MCLQGQLWETVQVTSNSCKEQSKSWEITFTCNCLQFCRKMGIKLILFNVFNFVSLMCVGMKLIGKGFEEILKISVSSVPSTINAAWFLVHNSRCLWRHSQYTDWVRQTTPYCASPKSTCHPCHTYYRVGMSNTNKVIRKTIQYTVNSNCC